MPLAAGVPDWEPVCVVKLRGVPTLLLNAHTSTSSDYDLLPLDEAGMTSILDVLGLARLGPSADLRSIPSASSIATLSSGGIVIYDGRGRRWFAARWIDSPETDPFAIDTDRPLPIVVVGGKLKSERNILSTIKDAAARHIAGGGRIHVRDYRMPSKSKFAGRYSFTDSTGSAAVAPEPDSVVLCDLNVLVDMYRALDRESEPPHFVAVRDTMAWIRCTDFRAGFAIGEAASAAATAAGPARPKDLAAAVDAWFDTPEEDLTWRNLHRVFDESRLRQADQSDLKDLAEGIIDLNYLALLRLALLWRPLDGEPLIPRDRVDAYARWVGYFNRVELGSPGFAHELAIALFLGDNSRSVNAAKLIRSPSRELIGKLRGSAWDLFYPQVLDTVSAGGVEDTGGRSVYLMTADRPLTFLRQSVATTFAVRTNRGTVTYLESEGVVSQKFSAGQLEKIAALHRDLWLDAQQRTVDRMTGHNTPDSAFVKQCIAASEIELGLPNLALE